jgi:hypothetical protein
MRTTIILILVLFGLSKVVLGENGFASFAALPNESDSTTNKISNYVMAPKTVHVFRILPEDVVPDSIQYVRFKTNQFAVRWTYTETGAQKMLAFDEAHEGQQVRTVIGGFESAPGEIAKFQPMPPVFTNYAQWKEGWLQHRTDKLFCVTEDEAKAITAGLQLGNNVATKRTGWLSFTNDAVQSRENFTGILTDPNFRVVIKALKQRTGAETLAEPEVVTVSGRGRNQMRMPDIVKYSFSVTNLPYSTNQHRAE